VPEEASGELGVVMVWEESPYGLVLIATSNRPFDMEGFASSAEENPDRTVVDIDGVTGVVLTSEFTTSILFARPTFLVLVEVDASLGSESALEIAGLVLAAP
jgi:hypothetical protein